MSCDLMYSCTSPVGSMINGHDGANIIWNRASHIVDSVRTPEYLCGNRMCRSPYSLRIDLNILF